MKILAGKARAAANRHCPELIASRRKSLRRHYQPRRAHCRCWEPALTDRVLTKAIAARARVVVLPCCQDARTGDQGGMGGWLDPPLAIDVTRAARLRAHDYAVHTQRIPQAITAKNRLLMGEPAPAHDPGAAGR